MTHLFPLFLARRGSTPIDPDILLWAVGIGLLVFVLWFLVSLSDGKKRREEIYRKYGHTEIAERLINKTIWVGETEGQLRDSLGSPSDTDQKVLKTKSKVIWKYAHKGGNRYGLRVTVENGTVVGWDEKL